MKTINISILNNYKGFRFNKKSRISKIFNKVFENIDINKKIDKKFKTAKTFLFDLVFTTDEEIKKVNNEYRGINKETDVITFSLFADDENSFVVNDEINLGEIIVSVDTAKIQAKKTIEYEIDLLILHGILHLLGFDHQTEEDYNFIVGIQNKIMGEMYHA